MEYTKPEVEIVLFDNLHDIITTSASKLQDGGAGGGEGGNWTDFI